MMLWENGDEREGGRGVKSQGEALAAGVKVETPLKSNCPDAFAGLTTGRKDANKGKKTTEHSPRRPRLEVGLTPSAVAEC